MSTEEPVPPKAMVRFHLVGDAEDHKDTVLVHEGILAYPDESWPRNQFFCEQALKTMKQKSDLLRVRRYTADGKEEFTVHIKEWARTMAIDHIRKHFYNTNFALPSSRVPIEVASYVPAPGDIIVFYTDMVHMSCRFKAHHEWNDLEYQMRTILKSYADPTATIRVTDQDNKQTFELHVAPECVADAVSRCRKVLCVGGNGEMPARFSIKMNRYPTHEERLPAMTDEQYKKLVDNTSETVQCINSNIMPRFEPSFVMMIRLGQRSPDLSCELVITASQASAVVDLLKETVRNGHTGRLIMGVCSGR